MAVFTKEEAKRFAALMAGFDIGNASEAEAICKGRVLRRMAAEKNIRLVDAWELEEIREAIDEQLQPVRGAEPIGQDCEDDETEEEGVSNEEVLSEGSLPSRIGWSFAGVLAWGIEALGLIVLLVGACVVGFVIGLWSDEA
jgi:hypothetical protein